MRFQPVHVVRPVLLLLSVLVASPLAAQRAAALPGFGAAAAEMEGRLEAILAAVPDTAEARRQVRTLSGWARVAGTPGSAAAADHVLREMARFGLDTSRATFEVFLPQQDSALVVLERPAAEGGPLRLVLDEPPLADDPWSRSSAWPAMNGSSGAGDVTAPLVYANYGLADDYRLLDSLGVSVQGKVVIARYGRGFRGIKAREAGWRGAAALLLYSDPADDGFTRGDVLPDGPMRSPEAVQRGSVFTAEGDPATPDGPSEPGAPSLEEAAMAIPRIPVVPLGYGNAARLLATLRQGEIPQAWQGGLPFRYHTGPGPTPVRVAVWVERGPRARHRVINTFGTLRGTDFPDEVVMVGAHRDSWGPGAADNGSGTTSVLEAARAWGEAARRGVRPRRTLVFATWDGEEWGLVGSTEWVEREARRLSAGLVAYLNQDMVAHGRRFGAGGTASLAALVRAVAALVPQPGDTGSVYAAWRRRAAPKDSEPSLGDLGGGSDFAGFYNHLAIPAFDFGFGGPQGIYHSSYDTPAFVERFGDPGYLSHRASATLVALALARLANADVVPFDHAAWGSRLEALVEQVRKAAGPAADSLDFKGLAHAAREVSSAGARFAAARDRALAVGPVPPARLAGVNGALRYVERAMLRPGGLPGRPWMQNRLFASDRNDGYANVPLPGVTEAVQDGDLARARAEVAGLRAAFEAARRALDDARKALEGA